MFLAPALLTVLVPLLSTEEQDATVGVKVVTVDVASISLMASASRKLVGEVKQGQEVHVIGYEGGFARIKRSDGPDGFVARTALTPKDKYVKAPANEKQMMEMKGQGYEAGRFDHETENKLRKDRGPEMDRAYQGVDAWEARQAWTRQKLELSKRLEEFRKAGKLSEFATVK
jgi:hypothetical protein